MMEEEEEEEEAFVSQAGVSAKLCYSDPNRQRSLNAPQQHFHWSRSVCRRDLV